MKNDIIDYIRELEEAITQREEIGEKEEAKIFKEVSERLKGIIVDNDYELKKRS